ncbi:MAG: hypothetical protein K8823_292 [Cenarchaeum symbiont of Oopsacas minuta]|nr:hypothetical protein [Cenarchaeum symbiont of Oopsacas minuta]
MTEENYAGNIIVALANLPDFLRKPMLKKRLIEFYTLDQAEKDSIVNNALKAGSDIPFENFAKLFETWLRVMAELPREHQIELFGAYTIKAAANLQHLAKFHLDGLMEIFLSLPDDTKAVIASSVSSAIERIGEDEKRKILLVIPDSAKKYLKL